MPTTAVRSRCFSRLAGALALAASACATTSVAFDPATESCATDADCVVTGFEGCCACDGEPHAVNRAALVQRTDICAVVECKCNGDCSCRRVASPNEFVAACHAGRCTAVHR